MNDYTIVMSDMADNQRIYRVTAPSAFAAGEHAIRVSNAHDSADGWSIDVVFHGTPTIAGPAHYTEIDLRQDWSKITEPKPKVARVITVVRR